MSLLYVSDVHDYLDTVLQHVKSEQGRSLHFLFDMICQTRVSVDPYVIAIRHNYLHAVLQHVKSEQCLPCCVYGKDVLLSMFKRCCASALCIHTLMLCYSMLF